MGLAAEGGPGGPEGAPSNPQNLQEYNTSDGKSYIFDGQLNSWLSQKKAVEVSPKGVWSEKVSNTKALISNPDFYKQDSPNNIKVGLGVFYDDIAQQSPEIQKEWRQSRQKMKKLDEGIIDYINLNATILTGAEGLFTLGKFGLTYIFTREMALESTIVTTKVVSEEVVLNADIQAAKGVTAEGAVWTQTDFGLKFSTEKGAKFAGQTVDDVPIRYEMECLFQKFKLMLL